MEDITIDLSAPTEEETARLAEIKANSRRKTIQGFRDLAQFLEDRPDLPEPICPTLIAHVNEASDFAVKARLMGDATKNPNGEWFGLTREFGPVSYEIYIQREKVCVKKVIGTELIPAYTREICEWECGSVLDAEREKQGVL